MRDDTKSAAHILDGSDFTCVLYRDGEVIVKTERGVKPLLQLLDEYGDGGLDGFSAADKVVGKGAAFLYVLLGITELFAPLISKAAAAVFTENNISFYYDNIADTILRRDKKGRCPIESALDNIYDAHTAHKVIIETLEHLNAKHE